MPLRSCCVVFFLTTLIGCTSNQKLEVTSAPTPTVSGAVDTLLSPLQFSDVTQKSGIKFKHNSGAFGLKLMPETMGSGVAVLDMDGDGYQDLFFVNSRYWTPQEIKEYQSGKWSQDEMTIFKRLHPPPAKPVRRVPAKVPSQVTAGALYRNNGDGTFSDVTKGSGLDIEMFGMGAAAADYDNDGKQDLYVTGLKRNYLFHNKGNGHFEEVSARLGVQDSGWSTSAAWLDYNKDGRLDLFVCHYVDWKPDNDRYGTMNGRDKSYTAPTFYRGEISKLFRQEANGKFRDVSVEANIRPRKLPTSKLADELREGVPTKSLGVALCDFNNDNWPDILVANDSQANCLFRNNKNGTFTEVSVETGIAYNAGGQTRAGMGIDAGDIDHSNRDSVVIGNFDNEMIGLYYNQDGLFHDIAPLGPVGQVSKTFSVFGCLLTDLDNDGWPDIFTASGHIDDQITGIRGTAYALRPLVFHNLQKGWFKEVGSLAGDDLQKPMVGRGLAALDFDLDGDVDLICTTNDGPAHLFRNDSKSGNSIRLILQGKKSNRSAIGALVKVKLGDTGLRRMVKSGSSYLSQSELPLTLGLGTSQSAEVITIHWPSGTKTVLRDEKANQILWVDEEKGIGRRKNLERK